VGMSMREGAKGRNFLMHHSLTSWERYLDAGRFFRDDQLRELLHADVLRELNYDEEMQMLGRKEHWLSAAQSLDLRRNLPLDIITKVDRMSMAHSLEVRVPLLDHKLVEFAATIPPELNRNGAGGKALLKKAMRGVLPDETI